MDIIDFIEDDNFYGNYIKHTLDSYPVKSGMLDNKDVFQIDVPRGFRVPDGTVVFNKYDAELYVSVKSASNGLHKNFIKLDKFTGIVHAPYITDDIKYTTRLVAEGDTLTNSQDHKIHVADIANVSSKDSIQFMDDFKEAKKTDILNNQLKEQLEAIGNDYVPEYSINLVKPMKRIKKHNRTKDLLVNQRKEIDDFLGYERKRVKIETKLELNSKNTSTQDVIDKMELRKEELKAKLAEAKAKKWTVQKVIDRVGKYYSDNDTFISNCASISVTLYLFFAFPYIILSTFAEFDLTIMLWIFNGIVGSIAAVPILVMTSIGLCNVFWKFPKRLFNKSDKKVTENAD